MPVLYFFISESHMDLLSRHLQRSVSQDLLQAESISTVDEIAYAGSVPADKWMKLGHLCPCLHSLEQPSDRCVRDWVAIGGQE